VLSLLTLYWKLVPHTPRAKKAIDGVQAATTAATVEEFKEAAEDISFVIQDLTKAGMHEAQAYCEVMHDLMISVYEGVLIAQKEVLLAKARTVYSQYKKASKSKDISSLTRLLSL
jgi:hypothetical protein